ncbi:rhomboid family intramembrane serine protease [Methanopyrus kandleri]|uniref:Predicted membrane serine protease of the Rhomboid superfamily n=2 Tax=Methanopyrus kandleri TaxID=2320 RepID=Q8TH01_METKA|nr:rhomboid family intramembrane serine protease [Methanopyrus kandleri]AAM01269.1 Predicted membrane serine protease of the Rhomboid superfamily [Methanopyrus kandleri AV19]HII70809.1 rhomboid family intramembrane serine protease [Methanopyrus kandleri]
MSLTMLMFLLNVLAYVLSVGPDGIIRPDVLYSYGLYLHNITVHPECLITYMFLHANLIHLLFNMLGLLTFGVQLERVLSTSEFLVLYLLSGLMGGLAQTALTPDVPVVGASAAIFGLLGCLTMLRPMSMMMFLFIPMPLALFAVLYAALALFVIQSGVVTQVAHAGHLVGMIVGGVLALLYRPSEALKGLLAVAAITALLLAGYWFLTHP